MTDTLKTDDPRLIEAEMLARKIIVTQPNNPDALNGLGLILMERADYASAEGYFSQAFNREPERRDFSSNLLRALSAAARTAVEAGSLQTAMDYLQKSLLIDPQRVETVCQIAFVLASFDRHADALEMADKAVSMNSHHSHAHDVRGLALLGSDKINDSVMAFRKALEIDSNFVSAHTNLGSALLARGDHRDALNHLHRALQLEPDNAMACNNLGLVLADMAKFAEAEFALRQAVANAPDFAEAHFNLSRVLLMQGKYLEGWQENEWRWKCRSFPSTRREFPYPTFGTEKAAGKTVLVWSEQGIGDEIMFANPIPDLIAEGASVIIECGERLVDVFGRSFPSATVVPRTDPPSPLIEQAGIDYQTPMGSLCVRYRDSKSAFEASEGRYLHADPTRQSDLANRYQELGPGPLVGICWRSGNPIAGGERSAPLDLWGAILTQAPCRFISLQYGEVGEDISEVKKRLGVDIHVDGKVNPLKSADDWFAQIGAMDLVISVDNSTIQVSGSQGVPTWTLVNYVPEWRFGMSGVGHDWHPSIRVYRQPSPGDWRAVFDDVGADFAEWHARFQEEGDIL